MKKTRKIIIFTVIIFIGLIIRNICNTKKQRSRSTIKIRLKRNRSNANTNETKKMGLLHRKYWWYLWKSNLRSSQILPKKKRINSRWNSRPSNTKSNGNYFIKFGNIKWKHINKFKWCKFIIKTNLWRIKRRTIFRASSSWSSSTKQSKK